jgi:hypothetical protein
MPAFYQAIHVSFDIFPDWQARILKRCAFCGKKSHTILFIRVPAEVRLKVERFEYHICLKCTKRLLEKLPPLNNSNILEIDNGWGKCTMCPTAARYRVAATFPLITKVEFLRLKGIKSIIYTIDAETIFYLRLCSTHVKPIIPVTRFIDYIKEGRG